MLVGIVVKNSSNRFLILKKKVENQIDLSLLNGEVEKDNLSQGIKDLLLNQTGVDFSHDIENEPLLSGVDEDGEYLILYCEKDLEEDSLYTKQNEMLWCSFNKIKKLYKDGRLNGDQLRIFKKAETFSQKNDKYDGNAMKVDHKANKRIENPSSRYQEALNGRLGDKRLVNRILDGRKVKPCGRECREYGLKIAECFNHSSFENFNELMNDEEFILEIAKITPNPTECENYFYQYVNPYMKAKPDFRLKFLKQVYLNKNVYKLKDINLIVEWCNLEEENKLILQDKTFKKAMERRISDIDYQDMIEYNCSGDTKELHNYKVKSNELKVLCENIKNGLKEILSTFEGEEKEKSEPKDFWAFMCSQTFNK